MTHRIERVNNLIREELSALLERGVKDPRLSGMTCITEVDTAPDMRHAKVYVSQIGDKVEKATTLAALRDASGYMRTELSKRMHMRLIPDLAFVWDDTIERGAHILELLDKVKTEDKPSDGK